MRLSQLLNRKVVTESGRTLGHVHDIRGQIVGQRLTVTGLVAGELGLLERYGIGTNGRGGPQPTKSPQPRHHPLEARRPRRHTHHRPRLALRRLCAWSADNLRTEVMPCSASWSADMCSARREGHPKADLLCTQSQRERRRVPDALATA